ncbi:hypothetical protein [Nocardia callitridis]|uniref:DUF2530 domain-containing protein n=1 Tax=Nocardia callitridis TaxID=648753 RepID=A0ABP9KXJ6_9NOCA
MARGEHPRRTPLYGALMMVAAWLAAAWASTFDATWLKGTVFAICAAVALIGFLMTFRDYS